MKNQLFEILMKVNPLITIITLTKNDPEGLLKTSISVNKQICNSIIEYLILDGSSMDIQNKNSNILKKIMMKDFIITQRIDMISKIYLGYMNR